MELAQLKQIEVHLNEPKWVSLAFAQINKDLAMVGMPEIEEESTDTALTLAEMLTPYFDNIIKYKPRKWAEFLYRADIPEHLLHSVMNEEDEGLPVVALLVVKREMFKVFVREKYKS